MTTPRYALFFDIDGTLVSFQTHEIPPSTILALTQAKANGHKVFIANAIPHKEAQIVIDDAKERQYGLIVIGERDIAVSDPKGEVDFIFRQQLAVKNLDQASPLDVVLDQRILQLTAFFDKDYEPKLMSRIPDCTSGRWHPAFTDITALEADKGKGLLTMAAHEGLDPQYTMAFGDGGNDTSMILTAGIGVAMGNAIDELKAAADFVTTSVDEEGIRHALRHFHLI